MAANTAVKPDKIPKPKNSAATAANIVLLVAPIVWMTAVSFLRWSTLEKIAATKVKIPAKRDKTNMA